MIMHPDDDCLPPSGTWADRFATDDEACAYYGADTPEQLRLEADAIAAEERDAAMDAMEAGAEPMRFDLEVDWPF